MGEAAKAYAIKQGTYREVVRVPSNKTAITFQGLGSTPARTMIVFHNSAGTHGTSGSAGMFVDGRDFIATNQRHPRVRFGNCRDAGQAQEPLGLWTLNRR